LTVYVDTSAAAKLLVDENESDALAFYLDDLTQNGTPLVSSMLLETELRRLGVRLDLDQSAISDVLERFDLYEPDRTLFTEAGLLAGANLRSLDALHVATALRTESRTMVAYDLRQADAARAVGLRIAAPA
jgi:predicted nucleic acid-binding protein